MEKTIEYTTAKGQDRVWTIAVSDVSIGDVSEITTTFGAAGGAMQTQTRLVKGKNLGRANETSAHEQAVKEAEARYKLKLSQVKPELPPPMLAQEFAKAGHHLVFPCYVQPKLNGVRGVYDPVTRQIYSRLGNNFPHLDHILKDLQHVLIPLDGELYSTNLEQSTIIHEGIEFPVSLFETLVGLVKKKSYDARILEVKFHVFDCMIPDVSFEKRTKAVHALNFGHNSNVVIVNTQVCPTAQNVATHFDANIAAGYEGIMLRNTNGLYINARSSDLQKLKPFLDDEFEIVGFKRENNTRAILWLCNTAEGREFSVRPMGTFADRCVPDEEAAQYIGAQLTVKYQELTARGVPLFPVGIIINQHK